MNDRPDPAGKKREPVPVWIQFLAFLGLYACLFVTFPVVVNSILMAGTMEGNFIGLIAISWTVAMPIVMAIESRRADFSWTQVALGMAAFLPAFAGGIVWFLFLLTPDGGFIKRWSLVITCLLAATYWLYRIVKSDRARWTVVMLAINGLSQIALFWMFGGKG